MMPLRGMTAQVCAVDTCVDGVLGAEALTVLRAVHQTTARKRSMDWLRRDALLTIERAGQA